MGFMDSLNNTLEKLKSSSESPRPSAPLSMGGGIGGGGAVSFEDDMIVSKPAIVCFVLQVFFNFIAMCCMASVAAFQQKWKVGPSGLTGFAIFVSVSGIFLSLFMLLTPVVYEKYDRGARVARALKEDRVGFILTGSGTIVSLLIAFIVTISAFTEKGCKNKDNDPHAGLGDAFKNGLPDWCNTKKAAGFFFWFAFIAWACSLGLTFREWRSMKSRRPKDPPFQHPSEDDYEADEASIYSQDNRRASYATPYSDINTNRYSDPEPPSIPPMSFNNGTSTPPQAPAGGFVSPTQPRPSIDAYGAFSDPAPTGYSGGDAAHNQDPADPRFSRTMQYADPYAAVRASITPNAGSRALPQPGSQPPSYSHEGRY